METLFLTIQSMSTSYETSGPIAVNVPEFSIGRSPENNLVLPNPEVSRRHCVIHLYDDEFILKDLSINGTFLEGIADRTESVLLRDGMVLLVGPYRLAVGVVDLSDENAVKNFAKAGDGAALRTLRVLASLTPREERVLRMRFGIGMKSDHTLEEVGQQFSVTGERIRQIEARALKKLKHPTRSRKLKSFLDDSPSEAAPKRKVETETKENNFEDDLLSKELGASFGLSSPQTEERSAPAPAKPEPSSKRTDNETIKDPGQQNHETRRKVQSPRVHINDVAKSEGAPTQPSLSAGRDQTVQRVVKPRWYMSAAPLRKRRGKALFRIPRQIWLEQDELAELRVSPQDILSVEERSALESTMVGRGNVTEEHAVTHIGRRMRARLHADNAILQVSALSSEEQETDLSEALHWNWRIVPCRTGQVRVTLQVTVLKDVDGGETTVDAQALHVTVKIAVNSLLTRPRRFLRDNWQWLASSSGGLAVIGAAYAVWLAISGG